MYVCQVIIACKFAISEFLESFNSRTNKQHTKSFMLSGSKITEIFCILDDFYNFYDVLTTKLALKRIKKHR